MLHRHALTVITAITPMPVPRTATTAPPGLAEASSSEQAPGSAAATATVATMDAPATTATQAITDRPGYYGRPGTVMQEAAAIAAVP